MVNPEIDEARDLWTYSNQFTDLPAAVNLSSTGGDNRPISIDIHEYLYCLYFTRFHIYYMFIDMYVYIYIHVYRYSYIILSIGNDRPMGSLGNRKLIEQIYI
jgi:hypothetical protein